MKNRDLSARLLVYLLGGHTELDDLKENYQEARTVEDVHYNSDGNIVGSKNDVVLPTKI